MTREKRNPENSHAIQILIEAEQEGILTHDEAEDLLRKFGNDTARLKRVDKAYLNKRYPNSRIEFFRAPVFRKCNRYLDLSSRALHLLMILASVMSQSNRVIIDRDIVRYMLRKDRSKDKPLSDKGLTDAIRELKAANMILEVKPKKGPNPPEYMINPRIGCNNKYLNPLLDEYWDLYYDHVEKILQQRADDDGLSDDDFAELCDFYESKIYPRTEITDEEYAEFRVSLDAKKAAEDQYDEDKTSVVKTDDDDDEMFCRSVYPEYEAGVILRPDEPGTDAGYLRLRAEKEPPRPARRRFRRAIDG